MSTAGWCDGENRPFRLVSRRSRLILALPTSPPGRDLFRIAPFEPIHPFYSPPPLAGGGRGRGFSPSGRPELQRFGRRRGLLSAHWRADARRPLPQPPPARGGGVWKAAFVDAE